ncbi:hypothetical protein Tco_0385975 [Tanacetum coccineum]
MRTRSASRPAAESLGGGTCKRISRGGRGRRPRECNDDRVDELNGQGNGLGRGANGGVEGANRNVGGANRSAPDFPTIIAHQLRNLLPAMLAQDCRSVPRNVNPVNARNPPVRACYECGSTDHVRPACPRWNRVRGRAFMLGAEEARQDPNIMTGLEPSDLGFKYEIEIASGQLVEIDKSTQCHSLQGPGYSMNILNKTRSSAA